MASTSFAIVKQEPEQDVEARFINICTANAKGVSNNDLQRMLPDVSTQQIAVVVNNLLAQGKIELQQRGDIIYYKLCNTETDKKLQGTEREERVVYKIIEQADSLGIWIRDIRKKCNLTQPQLTKYLRLLENKNLIKSVKSVGATRKKVYMLFDLEPDSSLVGGTFYSGAEFDIEFASLLSQQCCKYLESKAQDAIEKHAEPMARKKASNVPSNEVLEFIKKLKISTVDLKTKDIESVLNTLVWDAKAEMTVGTAGIQLYRAINVPLAPAGLIRVPCGMCPVFGDCHIGKVISPETCDYLKEWLDST